MFEVINEKTLYSKDFTSSSRYTKSYKFSHRFALVAFLAFRKNQKQESNLQEIDCLVTKNISVLCLWRAVLCFKGIQWSIEFHKRTFVQSYSCSRPFFILDLNLKYVVLVSIFVLQSCQFF